jgi:hypothetical protein
MAARLSSTPRERRHALDHVLDRGVDAGGPCQGRVQLGIRVLGRVLLQARGAQRVPGRDELLDPVATGDADPAGGDLRALGEKVEHTDQRDPAIQAAIRGVQVDELGGLPGQGRDRLQVPVLDRVGDEALLVLDLHRVEGAPVGVDADEEVLPRDEVDEHLRGRGEGGIGRACAHDNSWIGDGAEAGAAD